MKLEFDFVSKLPDQRRIETHQQTIYKYLRMDCPDDVHEFVFGHYLNVVADRAVDKVAETRRLSDLVKHEWQGCVEKTLEGIRCQYDALYEKMAARIGQGDLYWEGSDMPNLVRKMNGDLYLTSA